MTQTLTGFSAFIKDDGKWTVTRDRTKVIEAEGDVYINEDEYEFNTNLVLLADHEDKKHAQMIFQVGQYEIIFSDNILYGSLDDATTACKNDGTVYLLKRTLDYHQLHCVDDVHVITTYHKELNQKYAGFIVYDDNDRYKLVYDMTLYNRIERKFKKSCLQKENKRIPSKTDFYKVIEPIAANLIDTLPDYMKMRECWVWIAAYDTKYGRRVTNKILRPLAELWCNDRTKSRVYFGRWAHASVDWMDKRLASVLRLKRNSRHKESPVRPRG